RRAGQVRGGRGDRDRGARRRDRRRRRGEGRALHPGRDVEARARIHCRLRGATGQDNGPRGRDHLGFVGNRPGEEGGARGGGRGGRADAHRGCPARGRGRPPSRMTRRTLAALIAICAGVALPAAWAKTPLPSKPQGSGTEPTAGGGTIAGKPFRAVSAIAQYDVPGGDIYIYVFAKRVTHPCRIVS